MDVKKKEKKITMTAKKITVINEKGGVGKSSIVFNCAYELSREARVLMIDLDSQRANLTWISGIRDTEDNPVRESLFTMCDVVTGVKTMKECAITLKENLDIIPANYKIISLPTIGSHRKMKEALKQVENDYDYIFIDVDPTPSLIHKFALMSTDYAIIPMLPDILSLEANTGVVEDVKDSRADGNKDLKVLGILFNKNVDRYNLTKQVAVIADDMAAEMGTTVFKTKIRNAVSMSECPLTHECITEYDHDSAVAQDIRDLVKEIKERARW